jgi:hypothetical protein
LTVARRGPPQALDRSVLQRWAEAHPGEKLLIWTSGGKDSFCCLSLAVAAIGTDRIVPVYRYLVEGVRCVETPIYAQLARLGITHPLVKVPGADTLEMMRQGVYTTHEAVGKRQVKFIDIERLAKKRTGCRWTASGEKLVDSQMRRLWLRTRAPDGIDGVSMRTYPVHQWSQAQVRALCTLHRVPLAPNFGNELVSGLSFRVLDEVKKRYPADHAKIVAAFPFCEALAFRDRVYGERPRSHAQLRAQQVSEGGSAADSAERDQARALQPARGEQGSGA